MAKTSKTQVKKQLEADIAKYQNLAQVTMENANQIESQIQEAEHTLLRCRGIQEGVSIVKQHLVKRMEAYKANPEAQGAAIQELANVMGLAGELEVLAVQQSLRQEGVVQANRANAASLKEKSEEYARNARAKESQLNKADKSPMNTPEQEPPKTVAKKGAKNKASKKKATKKVAKKKATKKTKKKSSK